MTMNKLLTLLLTLALSGCITARVEDAREETTGLLDGESVVVMAKSYHQGNETEADYISCVEKALAKGTGRMKVIPNQKFVDELFPWFEPRTAPADTKGLVQLMTRPGVPEAVRAMGVRYIVWDLTDSATSGTVTADYSGTSFLPALVVPIPLIARTQSRACSGLAKQLKTFIVSDETT